MKNTRMIVLLLRFPALLFVLLLCTPIFHLPRFMITYPNFAHGLVIVAPIITTRPTTPTMVPRGMCKTLLHAPKTTAEAEEVTRGVVWVPPSQNAQQRRGNVFFIHQPQDLLDFVIEDDRLSVVKIYASWCKTCQIFDMRYRKLASQYGDKYDDDSQIRQSTQITGKGRARFAEMELKDHNQEILSCIISNSKQPLSLPYILMYKGSMNGMVKDFQCSPKKFRVLVDAVNELADSAAFEEIAMANGTSGDANEELNLSLSMSGDDLPIPPKAIDATTTTLANGLGTTQLYLSSLSTTDDA